MPSEHAVMPPPTSCPAVTDCRVSHPLQSRLVGVPPCELCCPCGSTTASLIGWPCEHQAPQAIPLTGMLVPTQAGRHQTSTSCRAATQTVIDCCLPHPLQWACCSGVALMAYAVPVPAPPRHRWRCSWTAVCTPGHPLRWHVGNGTGCQAPNQDQHLNVVKGVAPHVAQHCMIALTSTAVGLLQQCVFWACVVLCTSPVPAWPPPRRRMGLCFSSEEASVEEVS
jgi:hypothetical protein